MQRAFIGIGVVALVAGSYAVWASGNCESLACAAKAAFGIAQEAPAIAQAPATKTGRPSGRYDLAMAGCQFSCATKVEHDAADLVPQPGVKAGQHTRCPVSGVVFAVDESRPRVQLAAHDYATCCETCAGKLRETPDRFLD